MNFVDVKYERVKGLLRRQGEETPSTKIVTRILAVLFLVAFFWLIVYANHIGVARVEGMEVHTIMRVVNIRNGEVHLASEDNQIFIVPMPEMEIKKYQEVMVSFHILYNEGVWDWKVEEGMYITHVFDN